MRLRSLKSIVSFLLIVTSLATWSAPSGVYPERGPTEQGGLSRRALRSRPLADSEAGLEEIQGALTGLEEIPRRGLSFQVGDLHGWTIPYIYVYDGWISETVEWDPHQHQGLPPSHFITRLEGGGFPDKVELIHETRKWKGKGGVEDKHRHVERVLQERSHQPPEQILPLLKTIVEGNIGFDRVEHKIIPEFTQEKFFSGRVPSDEDIQRLIKAGLLLPGGVSHPQLTVGWIGASLVKGGLVGGARALDDVGKGNFVHKELNPQAQLVQLLVAHSRGRLLELVNFETKGEDPASLEAGSETGDPNGVRVPASSDLVEDEDAFVMGGPGALSVQNEGDGAKSLGSFPDEGVRALMVATWIDPARAEEVDAILKEHKGKLLEEYGAKLVEGHELAYYLHPARPVDELVRRVATLNGVDIGRIDVTIQTTEESDLEALSDLRETFGDMGEPDDIHGGTFRRALVASLGVKDGRIRLFLRRSGITEAVQNAEWVGPLKRMGPIVLLNPVSEGVKTSFRDRSVWKRLVEQRLKKLREPHGDFEQIRDAKKVFSSWDVDEPLVGSVAVLTNGQWPLDAEGVRQRGNRSTVRTLNVVSDPDRPGEGFLYLSEDTYPLTAAGGSTESTLSDVEGLTTGLEEATGYVAVEGVMAAVPDWAKGRVLGVPVGLAQTRAATKWLPPGRLVAVASGLEEVQAIEEWGVPENQIFRTRGAAIWFAEWMLKVIGGLEEIQILDTTARTLGELRLWLGQLPAAWQGSQTAGLEEQILQLEELGRGA